LRQQGHEPDLQAGPARFGAVYRLYRTTDSGSVWDVLTVP
jgi:hypothetical protein